VAHKTAILQSVWGLIVACWLALMLVLGGTSKPSAALTTLQTLLAAGLFGVAAFRIWQGGFRGSLAKYGTMLLVAAVVLVLLQTIPLPYRIWSALPGRQLIVDSFDLAHIPPRAHPLTLSTLATHAAAVALLPAVAAFLAALSFHSKDMAKVAIAIVLCALAATVLAVMQKLQFVAIPYADKPHAFGSGFFSNRNFYAAQLFCTIPFAAALAATALREWAYQVSVVSIAIIGFVVLMLVGLGAVGSRGGIVLAMVSLLASVLYVFKTAPTELLLRKRGSMVLVVIGLFFIVQGGLAGLLRLANTDVFKGVRQDIVISTLTAVRQYFPAGSGFGTFQQVYQIHENPSGMFEAYVNHAHNDWLEIMLEGGLAAMVLLVVFVCLVACALFVVTRKPRDTSGLDFQRAAAVTVVLLLCHAAVDFGLRTPALMSLFALCCGMMVASTTRRQQPSPRYGLAGSGR
jgi:O-antigen ligase